MKIIIYAEELVKMCVWDNYVYYIVGSEKDAEKILKENKQLDLTEREALIIGLTKAIETDNLIHKFNTYVVELLTNKSIKEKEYLLIRKKTFELSMDKFLDKFPDYWEPNISYSKSLRDLVEYISSMKLDVDKLEVHKIIDKNTTYEFYNSNAVKKLLSFNY